MVLPLVGCEYALQGEQAIARAILELTPIGTGELEARKLIEDRFGADSLWSSGNAKLESGEWRLIFLSDNQNPDKSGAYFHTYRISEYPSIYIIFKTYVYATWFFDSNRELIEVRVIKEIDAL